MSGAYNIKILLIEDNKGDARLIQELLKEIQYFGYTLEWRENLAAGIQALQKSDLDLLLLDLSLPDSQGLETVLKVLTKIPNVPVVVMTGHNDDALAIKAVGVGAQDYLIKGDVDAKILGRAIHYAIERHKLVKRLKEKEQALAQANSELESRVEERTKELKNAQDQIIRQEKLAMIGKLAASVSHEIRNPLGVISNSIYYLKTKLASADENIKKHLNYIQDESTRAGKIVSDLLDSARLRGDERIPLDLPAIIENTLNQIKPLQCVKIKKSFSKNLPKLKLDPRKMQQVFYNLVTNAIQALPNGEGIVEIDIGSDEKMMKIAIKDTGIGIPPENLSKVFEPLFTTKQKGIGLGLTIVREIVEGYGGTIHVESKVGFGTTFKVLIPIDRNY